MNLPPSLKKALSIARKLGWSVQLSLSTGDARLLFTRPEEHTHFSVVLMEDKGQSGMKHFAGSVLSYSGQNLSPSQKKHMDLLAKALEKTLTETPDWRALNPIEKPWGFAYLRAFGAADASQTWLVTLPSPCIQRCQFCDRSIGARVPDEAALKPVKEQLPWLKDLLQRKNVPPGSRLMVGGNEPLTYDGLEILWGWLRDQGHDPYLLQTAGWPITEEKALGLKNLGLRVVDIPLYSTQADIHDKLVQHPGAFEKTLTAIKVFQSAGISWHTHSLFLPQNLDHFWDLVLFAKNLGAERFGALHPTPFPGDQWAARGLSADPEAIERCLADTPELPKDFLKIFPPF